MMFKSYDYDTEGRVDYVTRIDMQGIKSCPWLALSSLIRTWVMTPEPEKYKYKYKGLQLWRRRSLSHLYWENTAWGIWLEILLIIYFISNCVGSQIPKLIVDFLKKKNFHTDQAWRLKRSHCAPRWQCYKNGPSIKITRSPSPRSSWPASSSKPADSLSLTGDPATKEWTQNIFDTKRPVIAISVLNIISNSGARRQNKVLVWLTLHLSIYLQILQIR